MADPRRLVPRTDTVLADPRMRTAAERLGPGLVRAGVRVAQDRVRAGEVQPDDLVAAVLSDLPESPSSLRPVLNATGVLVHTNLGRAPLSAAAVSALVRAAGCTDVELDLQTGLRGRRGRGALAALAGAVPSAEDVHVVNNNAAALALVATALAPGRDIVVSRGELVEIGDGFRIPDLLAATGARLREVGTTNRVHLEDYAAALGPDTALVLKVHPSNFVVRGFTSEVRVPELATLGVPVVVDTGSGLLAPHPRLPDEPDAATALRDGAALVTASGDKLLGGPQCGLLLGRADLVSVLRRHPMARALRVDKLTLAALEATLRGPVPPVPARLAADVADLHERAQRLATGLLAATVDAEVRPSIARVGGGGAPMVELPSAAVTLDPRLAGVLRAGSPAVLGRVEDGRLLLDLRAVDAADDDRLRLAVEAAARVLTADG
ncbi:MAG: L-seryl-tRNA(Sec) selenium transferase [Nocardioidaceae bacterium]|nr:L-seryl-tRNA(Sec) selenium transferase [Nocardioidaceae bacterium]